MNFVLEFILATKEVVNLTWKNKGDYEASKSRKWLIIPFLHYSQDDKEGDLYQTVSCKGYATTTNYSLVDWATEN